jgi:hypothetical protein
MALTNCLIVSPSDFPNGIHVLVRGKYPMTTRWVILAPAMHRIA